MISNNEKNKIIQLYSQGHSKVYIAEAIGRNRRTVIKYIKEMEKYQEQLKQVEVGSPEFHELTEKIAGPPQYKGKYKSRKKRKFTKEIEMRVDEIIADETRKMEVYGPYHKNKRNLKDFYEILIEEGKDISYSAVCKHVGPKLKKAREAFIKQNYDYGDRVEFDFGERKITIAGKVQKVYVAVLCCAATNFRDFYVYPNQKLEAFLDPQIRFFNHYGVPRQMVYDNMKNVVKRFVGRNERELTDSVIQLSNYYEFEIVLTNPYSGNEKGSVERSVAVITHDLFANRDVFESWEELIHYVRERQKELNKEIDFQEEQKYLKLGKPPLEIAETNERKVSKYSFIREDKNDYSVPEKFIGTKVTVKRYPHTIEIFWKGELIALHQRIHGENECRVKIEHYFKTLLRKPGALKNSVALDQVPKLKSIYENYYSDKPREFLAILMDNKELLDTDEICELLVNGNINSARNAQKQSQVEKASRSQLESVSTLFR